MDFDSKSSQFKNPSFDFESAISFTFILIYADVLNLGLHPTEGLQ